MILRRLAVISALVAVWPILAAAAPSRIAEVTVYGDRAQITRSASVSVSTGDVIVVLDGLPAALDDNSVQVWGKGTATVGLEGVSVELEPAPEIPEGKVAELNAKIEDLRDKKRALEEKRRAIDKRLSILAGIKPEGPRGDAVPVLGSFAELETIIAAVVNGLRAAYAEQRAIDVEIKRLNKEINALNVELNKIQSSSRGRTKRLMVNLSVRKAGSIDLGFSYVIGGAYWKPIYDVRALTDSGEVEISSHAEIVQRTGEDWNDVALSVSTAKPHVGGTPPELQPIYLFFYTPPPPRQPMAPPPPSARRLAMPSSSAPREAEELDADEPAPEPVVEAVADTAQVKSAGTAVFFEVKARKTIPSDGEPHRVPIAVDVIKAEFSHAAWPEAKPLAYLRAKMTNTTGHPFVGGSANVFVGTSFIGSTAIADWSVTEEKTLSLGVDQGVKVERKTIKRDEKESGSKITILYEYKIEVKNFKQKPITLHLYDRIPTSRQGDIEVRPETLTPTPTKIEDNSIVKWELTIQPGASATVTMSYTVKYPKGRRVVGLP